MFYQVKFVEEMLLFWWLQKNYFDIQIELSNI